MEQQGYKGPSRPPRRHLRGGEPDLPAVDRADWRLGLRQAILSRVVPRMSESARAADGAEAAHPTDAEVAAFSDMVLVAAVPVLVAHVGALRADGLSTEAVMLRLLAPAARRLGDMWLDDRLSFLDVTMGLGRLQGVVRALGSDFEDDAPGRMDGRRVLLAPAPGEQHVFGLSVVATFFRRAGWDVTCEPRIGFDDLLCRVGAERFDAIGLSVAGDKFLDTLPAQIEALRRASLAPDVVLLAGGPAFLEDPSLRERVGVDAVASDAAEAVRAADALSSRAAAARAS